MSQLTVRFWGTRGSIPTPGRTTEKYGGNTTCLELRYDDTIVVVDAGSGIRSLSDAWAAEFAQKPIQAHLLLTHLHWDHIQGFPFFAPAYVPGNSFVIYGEERPTGNVHTLLGVQMTGDFFPVPLSAMGANLDFRSTSPEFSIGRLRVRTHKLPHPGGSLAYRIEVDDSVFVLATDCELDQAARNQDELTSNYGARRKYEADLIDFLTGANLLVVDCQFTDDQYRNRRGWGHNGLTTVGDLCLQVRPDMLALCHHDPQNNDDRVTQMVLDLNAWLEARRYHETLVFAAREQLTMRVQKPKRPPKVD